MAAGVIAIKPGAARAAFQPVALALLVTGGVGYYSYNSVSGAAVPVQTGEPATIGKPAIAAPVPLPAAQSPVPDLAALPAPEIAPASQPQLAAALAPVSAPMVVPVAQPVLAEPVIIKAAAQFAPTAASAPLMGRKHRRITGRFNPAPFADVQVASLAVPDAFAGQSAVLTPQAPVAPVVTLAPAPPIAMLVAEPVAAPLVSQITAPELPGPPLEPSAMPQPAIEAPAPALVAPPPVAVPASAAAAPSAPAASAEPVAALVPALPAASPRADAAAAIPPAPRAIYGRYRLANGVIEFAIPAQIDGHDIGTLPLRIGQGNAVSVRLGDLLAILQPRMDSATYDRLSMSRAADEYVGFDALRKAGIAVHYDAVQDQILMGTEKTL